MLHFEILKARKCYKIIFIEGSVLNVATPMIMPRPNQSVESCIISEWHKKVGEKVSSGDNLFSYETGKATFDEASKVEGELLAIFFEEGDDVPCLVNICVVGQKGEDASSYNPNK